MDGTVRAGAGSLESSDLSTAADGVQVLPSGTHGDPAAEQCGQHSEEAWWCVWVLRAHTAGWGGPCSQLDTCTDFLEKAQKDKINKSAWQKWGEMALQGNTGHQDCLSRGKEARAGCCAQWK